MMKSLVCKQPGELALVERAMPTLSPGWASNVSPRRTLGHFVKRSLDFEQPSIEGILKNDAALTELNCLQE